MPVTFCDTRMLAFLQLRENMRERIAQAHADDESRVLVARYGEPEIAASRLQRLDDCFGGVHQRAVPVEHQEIETLAHHAGVRKQSRKFWRSIGSADSNARLSAVRGWWITALHACRNIRLRPFRASSLLSAKSPYLSSPRIGKPRCARCTRIWCVRPVLSSASSKLYPFSRVRRRIRVWDGSPPSRTLTRRSPEGRTYLVSGSSTSRLPPFQVPRTRVR